MHWDKELNEEMILAHQQLCHWYAVDPVKLNPNFVQDQQLPRFLVCTVDITSIWFMGLNRLQDLILSSIIALNIGVITTIEILLLISPVTIEHSLWLLFQDQ